MNRRLILAGCGSFLVGAAVLFAVTSSTWRPAQALTNCETSTASLNAAEQNVVELLNAYRQQNGLSPVKASPGLSQAAAWITEDMTAKKYFNHFEPGGRSPFQRAVDCGYPSQNIGENLAISGSGGGAMTLWKGSAGHNANMLMSRWVVVGIGQAGGYWSMVLGAVDDSGSGANSPISTPTPKPTPTPGPNDPSALPIRRAMLQMVASE